MSSNLLQLNSNRNYPGFTQDIINPNSTHKSTTGFNVGHVWANIVIGTSYILIDETLPTWHLISSYGVKLNTSAIVDPTSLNDNTPGGGGYGIGSIWINTVDNSVWIATKVTAPAIWIRLSDMKNNFADAFDPAPSDNSSQGYGIGSRWVNTSNGKLWTLVKLVGAVATWFSPAESIINTAPVPPVSTDDLSNGFGIGDIWVDTASGQVYISIKDTPAGTAIWTRINQVGLFSNYTSLVDPTLTDDISLGYVSGSIWVNTVTRETFIAESTVLGVAVWVAIFDAKNNYTANVNPSPADNNAIGKDYAVGSKWINTITNTLFTLVDINLGVATWVASGSATVAAIFPVGPTLGQLFHNTTNDLTYIWDGSAWIDISAAGGAFVKNNFTATVDPLPTNDGSAVQGYDVGSVWINTITSKVFTATDVAINAAKWVNETGSPIWTVLTANHIAISGEHLALDSSLGIFTVTLPLSPLSNSVVYFMDAGRAMTINNVTIARNGQTILGLLQNLIINTSNTAFGLAFINGSWSLV